MPKGMTKIRTHKGFVIAMGNSAEGSYDLAYFIFTKDNWATALTRNAGYAEFECETMEICLEWIG